MMRITKGFSLLEVLVATFILTLAFLYMIGMFPASEIGLAGAKNTHFAVEFAKSKIEYWMQQGYSVIASKPATIESGTASVGSTVNGMAQSQTINWSVSHAQMASGIQQIDVLTYWSQKGLSGGVYSKGTLANPTVRLVSWVYQ